VHFAFSDEQLQLRRAVRHVLERECAVRALRDHERAAGEQQAPPAGTRWRALAALGLPGLLVPTERGGLGLSSVDLVGIFEEAGWSALPEPLLESAGVAAPMLAALSPAPPAVDALRHLVAGEAPLALGGVDVGAAGPTSPTTVSADGMLRTPRVSGARDAEVYILACRDPDSGWQLHAVPARACRVRPTATLDPTRDLSTVHWPLSAETLLAFGIAAEASVGLMVDRAAAGSAAFLVGLGDRVVALAADHAKERGLGATRHQLAAAGVRLELARPTTYRAAWSLATAQPTASHDASLAKAMASDAAELAAHVALQVYGAIGLTVQCDLHVFLRRIWALCGAWGDAVTHRQLLLAEMG
jgi:alkylation response protein AidB-like acyl-CoA dehydrogenase